MLVQVALAARSGDDMGLKLADAVAPFAEPGFDIARNAVRVLAARRNGALPCRRLARRRVAHACARCGDWGVTAPRVSAKR
jgi:hypothetical protein